MGLGEVFGIGLPWTAWRNPEDNFRWNKQTADKLLEEVKQIEPSRDKKCEQKVFKALLIGANGHGKSSLINSFASVCEGKKTSLCNSSSLEENVTKAYRNFKFPNGLNHCVIADIPGVPQLKSPEDPFLNDIRCAIQGHIKHGYEFKAEWKESITEEDAYYEKSPSSSDTVHCVIIVIDGTHAEELSPSFVLSIKEIMKTIDRMNVPVMVVLTKADKISRDVKYSTDSIFRCKKIHQAVQAINKQLGIPMPKVFPVVNFEDMDTFSWKESIPILIAMRFFLRMANAQLNG